MKALETLKIMIAEKQEELEITRAELDYVQSTNNVQDQLTLAKEVKDLVIEINRLEGLLWALSGN